MRVCHELSVPHRCRQCRFRVAWKAMSKPIRLMPAEMAMALASDGFAMRVLAGLLEARPGRSWLVVLISVFLWGP